MNKQTTQHHLQELTLKKQPPQKRLLTSVVLMLLSVSLYFFLHSPYIHVSHWDLINKKGILKYGTRTSLLSYFEVGDKPIGYEYEILKAFTKQQGLILKPIVYKNNGDLLSDLNQGIIDIAGGHLSLTKERKKHFDFSYPISHTAINLVTHYEYRQSENLSDFAKTNGQLIANSSYAELLAEIDDFASINIDTTSETTLFELFRKINRQEIDFTFADSEIIKIYQNFIPGIYQPIQLSPKEEIVFYVPNNRSNQFITELNRFIENAETRGQLTAFKSSLTSQLPNIDIADTVTFFDKLQTRWPEIRKLVQEVAKEHQFDPALLAAVSYQESHWNTEAISVTGVRGLMMLTESTAQEMGVIDRTDPRESLVGGVKYIKKMKAKIPSRITEPDRTLFALASYNVGFGHLEDARILAQKAGKNPDIWLEVEPHLKQLNNPVIAHELMRGNADGKTAVVYVNNIMTYKQLMTWKIQKEKTTVTTTW